MIKTIYKHYKGSIASIVGLFLVYGSGRGLIEMDTAKFVSELCLLIFGSVNAYNHMNTDGK